MTKRQITIITLAIILASFAATILWTPIFRVNAVLIGVLGLVAAFGAGIIWRWRRSAYPALAWMGAVGLFLVTLWYLPHLICPYTMRQLGVIPSRAACPCGSTKGPCNDYHLKPCGGWSSQMNKSISCSAGGVLTVDGNVVGTCAGCCFSYEIYCNDCPNANPPSVTGSLTGTFGLNGWIVASPFLSLSSSDPDGDATTITGDINGSGFSCGANCTQNLPEGTGNANYIAHDSSRDSAPGSQSFKVDTAAPSLAINLSGTSGSNGWYISAVDVSPSASDAISRLASAQVRVNSGSWQSTLTLTDGIYTVDALAMDNAGNQANAGSSVKVDATPPLASVQIDGTTGNNGWYTSVSASLPASDAVSGVASAQVSFDGTIWSSSIALTDGTHTVQGRAVDQAGNTSDAVPISVKMDGTAPSVVIATSGGTTGLAGWYTGGTIMVTAASSSDATSGIALIERRINGGVWEPGATISFTGDGIYTIDFRVTDNAGNISTDSTILRIDIISPTLNASIPSSDGANEWFTSSPVSVDFSASDNLSGVNEMEYSLDGGPWVSGSTASVASDGQHQVRFRATDNAGNQSEDLHTINIDTTPPNTSMTSPLPGSTIKQVVVFCGIALDAGSGMAQVQVSPNGNEWEVVMLTDGSWQYKLNAGRLDNGPTTLFFRVTDIAGLVNETSFAFTVKNPPIPIISIFFPKATETPTITPTLTTISKPAQATLTPMPTIIAQAAAEIKATETPVPVPTPVEPARIPDSRQRSAAPMLVLLLSAVPLTLTMLGDPRPRALNRLATILSNSKTGAKK